MVVEKTTEGMVTWWLVEKTVRDGDVGVEKTVGDGDVAAMGDDDVASGVGVGGIGVDDGRALA